MRTLAIVTAALLAIATGALATPALVSVSIAPALQAKAAKTLGVREVNDLADQLRARVERRLAKTGAYEGARLELVLVDVQPNRPTFKQMADKPGLSFESFGVGGARIEGRAVTADGVATPLGYSYYEPDIAQAAMRATWSDAEWTIDRFAYRLGRGEGGVRR